MLCIHTACLETGACRRMFMEDERSLSELLDEEAERDGGVTFTVYGLNPNNTRVFRVRPGAGHTEYVLPRPGEYQAVDALRAGDGEPVKIEAFSPWEAAKKIAGFYRVGSIVRVADEGKVFSYRVVARNENNKDSVIELEDAVRR